MNINEFATNVANETYIDDNLKAIDPITILMIINLVITVGKIIYECIKKNREERVRNPNVFDRVSFKLMVVRHVGMADFMLIKGNKLVNSMLNQAAKLTNEEVAALFTEIDNSVI